MNEEGVKPACRAADMTIASSVGLSLVERDRTAIVHLRDEVEQTPRQIHSTKVCLSSPPRESRKSNPARRDKVRPSFTLERYPVSHTRQRVSLNSDLAGRFRLVRRAVGGSASDRRFEALSRPGHRLASDGYHPDRGCRARHGPSPAPRLRTCLIPPCSREPRS